MCYSVTGWLKRHLEYINSALDGGNREQYISLTGRRGSLTAGGGGAAGVPEVLLRVADEDQEDQQHGHPAAGAGHFLLRGGWVVLGLISGRRCCS